MGLTMTRAGARVEANLRTGLQALAGLDVAEVPVGPDLELGAGVLVADDHSLGVVLQGAGRPQVVDPSLDDGGKGPRLVVAGDEEDDLPGVHHRADADGEGAMGDLLHVAPEKPGIGDAGVAGQRLHPRPRSE